MENEKMRHAGEAFHTQPTNPKDPEAFLSDDQLKRIAEQAEIDALPDLTEEAREDAA